MSDLVGALDRYALKLYALRILADQRWSDLKRVNEIPRRRCDTLWSNSIVYFRRRDFDAALEAFNQIERLCVKHGGETKTVELAISLVTLIQPMKPKP